MSNFDTTTSRPNRSQTTYGIDPDDRELLVLDDLRVEQRRTREAVERQNDLLGELLARIDATDSEVVR